MVSQGEQAQRACPAGGQISQCEKADSCDDLAKINRTREHAELNPEDAEIWGEPDGDQKRTNAQPGNKHDKEVGCQRSGSPFGAVNGQRQQKGSRIGKEQCCGLRYILHKFAEKPR